MGRLPVRVERPQAESRPDGRAAAFRVRRPVVLRSVPALAMEQLPVPSVLLAPRAGSVRREAASERVRCVAKVPQPEASARFVRAEPQPVAVLVQCAPGSVAQHSAAPRAGRLRAEPLVALAGAVAVLRRAGAAPWGQQVAAAGARVPDAPAGPQQAVAVGSGAPEPRRVAGRGAAVPRPEAAEWGGRAPPVALPLAEPDDRQAGRAAAVPLEAASACRRGRLRPVPAVPVPPRTAPIARAMRSLRKASRKERSWQAARNVDGS
jgi:hypothetical protein